MLDFIICQIFLTVEKRAQELWRLCSCGSLEFWSSGKDLFVVARFDRDIHFYSSFEPLLHESSSSLDHLVSVTPELIIPFRITPGFRLLRSFGRIFHPQS